MNAHDVLELFKVESGLGLVFFSEHLKGSITQKKNVTVVRTIWAEKKTEIRHLAI